MSADYESQAPEHMLRMPRSSLIKDWPQKQILLMIIGW
jgi:hypothetical protein